MMRQNSITVRAMRSIHLNVGRGSKRMLLNPQDYANLRRATLKIVRAECRTFACGRGFFMFRGLSVESLAAIARGNIIIS